MELASLSMCSIPLDFGEDTELDFNGFPADGSSASVSGSSYASSSLGPQTPTSGRSTPPFSNSFDFGISFASSSFDPHTPTSSLSSPPFSTSFDFGSSFSSSVNTVPFDFRPSSSAASTYFPMTPKTGNISDLTYPVFPVTPSRTQHDFSGHLLGSCGTQPTPSQSMGCSFFINQLGLPPPLSTPSALTQLDHLSDTAAHWMYPESPISFDQRSPSTLVGAQPIKQEPDQDTTTPSKPSSTTRKQALMDEARHRTTMLQEQVQQRSPPKGRFRAKRERKPRAVVTVDGDFAVGNFEAASTFKCPMEGCMKPYRRAEHMKRHIQTAHQGAFFPCKFCDHVANRKDNMVAHLKLHTLTRPKHGSSKPRVKYFAAAALVLDEETKQSESRRRRSTKASKRSTLAA